MIPNQRTLVIRLRQALLFGAVATTLGLSAPVLADDQQPADTQTTGAQNGSGNQSGADATATQLGNITVTAQSRTQQVQEVPIAVQVVTKQQIDNIAATDLS